MYLAHKLKIKYLSLNAVFYAYEQTKSTFNIDLEKRYLFFFLLFFLFRYNIMQKLFGILLFLFYSTFHQNKYLKLIGNFFFVCIKGKLVLNIVHN